MTRKEFIKRDLQGFNINSGWERIVSEMLGEIYDAGWNTNIRVGGKTKFGELRSYCYHQIEEQSLRTKINNIVHRYKELSLVTCEICGKPGKLRFDNDWYYTYCVEHYIERNTNINIENNNLIFRGREYDLTKISRIESENILYSIWLYYEKIEEYIEDERKLFNLIIRKEKIKFFKSEEKLGYMTNSEQNYFLLLKKLPMSCFNSVQKHIIMDLKNSLKPCKICGYKAVYQGKCFYCHNFQWDSKETSKDSFKNENEYIKELQMELLIDEDDYMKIRKYDNSFEKIFEPQRLFTDKELENYIEELKDIEE
jgi:hypothetical protein